MSERPPGMPILGRSMREGRQRLGLSQKEMAARLGITPQYLCDIESDRRRLPPLHLPKVPVAIRYTIAHAMRVDAIEEIDRYMRGPLPTPEPRG